MASSGLLRSAPEQCFCRPSLRLLPHGDVAQMCARGRRNCVDGRKLAARLQRLHGPIAIAPARNTYRGVRRGFLPRGLCNTCPDAARERDRLRARAGVTQALTQAVFAILMHALDGESSPRVLVYAGPAHPLAVVVDTIANFHGLVVPVAPKGRRHPAAHLVKPRGRLTPTHCRAIARLIGRQQRRVRRGGKSPEVAAPASPVVLDGVVLAAVPADELLFNDYPGLLGRVYQLLDRPDAPALHAAPVQVQE